MINTLFTNGNNKVLGKDDKGFYIGFIENNIVTKKHHLTDGQVQEVLNKWLK